MNTPCPDDELLGCFVAGALEPSEVQDMDRHLGGCEECRRIVASMAGAGEAPEHRLRPGAQVGRYRIVSLVGTGGMAVVYRAHDPQLDRDVALKLLRADDLDVHSAPPERILREAKAMARLSHPNVIAVHDAGEFDGRVFVAMELVEGRTLRQWLGAHRTTREILGALLQAGRGLAAAHAAGLVHRDFKPDNVLVGDDGRVRITDFGLARVGEQRDALQSPPGQASGTSTRSGTILGSPAYMAPEQIRGEEVGPKTDLFAFCVTAWELLFGVRPFRGETLDDLRAAIAGRRIEEGNRSRVPSGIRTALLQGLSADAARRPSSMDELLSRLERNAQPSRRKRTWLAAAMVVALAAAGAMLSSRRPGERQERLMVGVADFVNQTGEDALGGLSAMLITSLEQSRRISVLTRSRMLDLLAQTGNRAPARIDETTGREICKRAGAAALVVGSIGKYGGLYTIEVKLLEPQRNEYIFAAREEARDWEHVPAMIDRLAAKVRLALHDSAGDSGSAEGAAASMAKSLEAYRHYLDGEQLRDKGVGDPIAEFKKAIAIEPDFVLAHYQLASMLATEQARDASEPIAQAMRLIARAPAKEQMHIRALDARIRGDDAAAISLHRALLASYPQEKQAHLQLGDLLLRSRKDDPAAFESFRRALELDPEFASAWNKLTFAHWFRGDLPGVIEVATEYARTLPSAYSYYLLGYAHASAGHIAEAKKAFKHSADLFPERAAAEAGLAAMHFIREEWDAAADAYRNLLQSSRTDWLIKGYKGLSWVAASRGRYREALRWLDEDLRVARAARDGPETALAHGAKALWLARGWKDVEGAEREIELATASIDPAVEAAVQYKHALWYAIAAELAAGRLDRAAELAERNRPLVGENHSDLPLQVAQLHLQGRDDEAQKAFEAEIAFNWDSLVQAQLAEWHFGQGRMDAALEAATRFLALVPVPHADVLAFRAATVPQVLLLAAACQEAMRDRPAAVKTLHRLVDNWAQADPDLLDLKEARLRLARLEPALSSR